MSGKSPEAEALWGFAQRIYAGAEAQALLLELQDRHGQCVSLLLWGLWAAAQGRADDDRSLGAAVALARGWEHAATGPLRTLRRAMRQPPAEVPPEALAPLRAGVAALELEAERRLLEQLEARTPPAIGPPADALGALLALTAAWGAPPPRALLQRLVGALS